MGSPLTPAQRVDARGITSRNAARAAGQGNPNRGNDARHNSTGATQLRPRNVPQPPSNHSSSPISLPKPAFPSKSQYSGHLLKPRG